MTGAAPRQADRVSIDRDASTPRLDSLRTPAWRHPHARTTEALFHLLRQPLGRPRAEQLEVDRLPRFQRRPDRGDDGHSDGDGLRDGHGHAPRTGHHRRRHGLPGGPHLRRLEVPGLRPHGGVHPGDRVADGQVRPRLPHPLFGPRRPGADAHGPLRHRPDREAGAELDRGRLHGGHRHHDRPHQPRLDPRRALRAGRAGRRRPRHRRQSRQRQRRGRVHRPDDLPGDPLPAARVDLHPGAAHRARPVNGARRDVAAKQRPDPHRGSLWRDSERLLPSHAAVDAAAVGRGAGRHGLLRVRDRLRVRRREPALLVDGRPPRREPPHAVQSRQGILGTGPRADHHAARQRLPLHRRPGAYGHQHQVGRGHAAGRLLQVRAEAQPRLLPGAVPEHGADGLHRRHPAVGVDQHGQARRDQARVERRPRARPADGVHRGDGAGHRLPHRGAGGALHLLRVPQELRPPAGTGPDAGAAACRGQCPLPA